MMKHVAVWTAIAMAAPMFAPLTASADPQVYVRDRDANWKRDRYERYERSHWAKDFHGRWTPLARNFNAETDVQDIFVKNQVYSRIRFEGVRGEPVIQKIAIEFANKTSQEVELGMRLGNGTGEVIDLNGGKRSIVRIIVWSAPRTHGTFSVYGS